MGKQKEEIQGLQKDLESKMEQAQGNGPELLNQSTQSYEDHPPSKERIMKKAQEHFITNLGKNRVI